MANLSIVTSSVITRQCDPLCEAKTLCLLYLRYLPINTQSPFFPPKSRSHYIRFAFLFIRVRSYSVIFVIIDFTDEGSRSLHDFLFGILSECWIILFTQYMTVFDSRFSFSIAKNLESLSAISCNFANFWRQNQLFLFFLRFCTFSAEKLSL